jgi:hypothetical protein
MSQDREQLAESLFDLQMSYMKHRLDAAMSGEDADALHPSELKEIRQFLSDQGITCAGSDNKKAKNLASSLPVNVSQLRAGNSK